ncbi:MAG: hypothetical protein A2Z11_04295 [Candidatus Woykebacteria bacterium RBG_16_43_9]|uniref:Phosphatidic acid phosphatase type 2/haloperoxidase domain-containing protein n=1 Tax=Candidatus Woykebacteria bacterium RBG_16_43_9 TaxID=1802596 RepID=A0A1G1WG64_9BACT|nr:MAG: hypothetical protein A2Z11_04295 [Candidatus Woykebacteria bacterium RBG_16_43_9]
MLFKQPLSKQVATIVFGVLVIGFFILTYFVSTGRTDVFDSSGIEKMQALSSPALTWFMIFVSSFSDGFFPVVFFFAFALALLIKGYKKEAYFSFIIWIGPLLSWILKMIIARMRPEDFLVQGYSLPTDHSYPSGHVVFYTVFFGLVAFYALTLPNLRELGRKFLLTISVALIILVGFSRIYLGVHWPTDVIGGYLLGFSVLGILTLLYLRLIQNK